MTDVMEVLTRSDAALVASWNDGLDTLAIAERFRLKEAEVYNRLARIRAEKIARLMPTIDECINFMCERTGIRRADLVYGGMQRNLVKARQLAMALARETTGHSFPAIAKQFGGCDHTTVIHNCQQAARLYPEEFRTLKQRLLAAKEAAA